MSTEYHQLPSQQGKMPLDYIADNDPWLISATSALSLDAWAPPSKTATATTKSLVMPTAKPSLMKSPLLFEHAGHDSDGWAKATIPIVPDITNVAIKKPTVAPNIPKGVEFFSTSSKIDAWTVTAPTTNDSKKKSQLKLQQQQVAQQVQIQQQQQQQLEEDDEEDKAIEDELAIQNRYKTELCKSFTGMHLFTSPVFHASCGNYLYRSPDLRIHSSV